MTAQQSQEPSAQAPAGTIPPVHRPASVAVAGLRHERADQGLERGLEEEWQSSLRNLQQFICELLLKNQQLRMRLEAATNLQTDELPR